MAVVMTVLVQPRDGWAANSQIEAIVAEAVERNPAVAAAREHYEAQEKMPIQAGTLPDPEISLQQLTVGGPKPFEGYETSDFFYTGIGATQEIPWPGKLRLRSSAASRDAEIAKQQYRGGAPRGCAEGPRKLLRTAFPWPADRAARSQPRPTLRHRSDSPKNSTASARGSRRI